MISKRVPPARINNQWCPLYELSTVGEDLEPTPNVLGIFQIVHIRNKGWRDCLLTYLHKDKNKRHDVEMIEEDSVWGRWVPIYGPNYTKKYVKKHNDILESATKQKSATKRKSVTKKKSSAKKKKPTKRGREETTPQPPTKKRGKKKKTRTPQPISVGGGKKSAARCLTEMQNSWVTTETVGFDPESLPNKL